MGRELRRMCNATSAEAFLECRGHVDRPIGVSARVQGVSK